MQIWSRAALSLGANGWQTFRRVTLPNIRWGLLYGVLLCNARAMGEFGAVSVVSGHIRGMTNTLPLHVEILHNEFSFAAATTVYGCFIASAASKGATTGSLLSVVRSPSPKQVDASTVLRVHAGFQFLSL